MIARNEEMMWQEGYYRGYFNLKVSPESVTAQFYGMSFFFFLYYINDHFISKTLPI